MKAPATEHGWEISAATNEKMGNQLGGPPRNTIGDSIGDGVWGENIIVC